MITVEQVEQVEHLLARVQVAERNYEAANASGNPTSIARAHAIYDDSTRDAEALCETLGLTTP